MITVRSNISPAKFLVLFLLGYSISANGADFEFDLSLASIYTSNLALEPSELADSQWLNAILPRFYLMQTAPRYHVDFSYEPQAVFYVGQSEFNAVFHQAWTNGRVDVAADKLFFRGLGRLTQINVDPEGRLSSNNIYRTRNRSDVLLWEAGPELDTPVFGRSEIDAHFYVGKIRYSDDAAQDVDTEEAEFVLGTNYAARESATYEFFYRYRNFDYERTGPVKFQHAQIEFGYFTSQSLQLVGIAGLESNLATNDGSLDEPFWTAGVRSWLGENRLEAFYGRRYFGPTFWLTWERIMQRSQLYITYRETQQTDESAAIDDLRADADSGRDPGTDESLPDTTIDRPGSGIRSLNKEARLDYRLDLYRTYVHLAVFWRDREQILSNQIIPSPPQDATSIDRSVGLEFDTSWDVGAKTTMSILGRWTRRNFDVQQEVSASSSDLFQIDGRVDYDIGLYMELSAVVGYQTQQGREGTFEYNELHAALQLRRYFL